MGFDPPVETPLVPIPHVVDGSMADPSEPERALTRMRLAEALRTTQS